MHGRDRDPIGDPPVWWTWAIIAAWVAGRVTTSDFLFSPCARG
jgi:hypothetical protein